MMQKPRVGKYLLIVLVHLIILGGLLYLSEDQLDKSADFVAVYFGEILVLITLTIALLIALAIAGLVFRKVKLSKHKKLVFSFLIALLVFGIKYVKYLSLIYEKRVENRVVRMQMANKIYPVFGEGDSYGIAAESIEPLEYYELAESFNLPMVQDAADSIYFSYLYGQETGNRQEVGYILQIGEKFIEDRNLNNLYWEVSIDTIGDIKAIKYISGEKQVDRADGF